MNCFEDDITDVKKRKRPTEEAENLLEKSKADLRMLKGVEDVSIIDSFVVDKSTFLNAYKISEESGKLFTFNEFFKTEGDNPGTVYETEIGNKIYYAACKNKYTMQIVRRNSNGSGKKVIKTIRTAKKNRLTYVGKITSHSATCYIITPNWVVKTVRF